MFGVADSTSTKHSSELHRRALKHVPGGVHSNTRLRKPHPVFASHAAGAYVWDVDDVQYLDMQMGNGAVALGYGRQEVDAAVISVITAGLSTGVETAAAVDAVEALTQVIPQCGMLRFANTGTEALMHALAVARNATGRERIAKPEASYHGWHDPLWVSTWPPRDAGPDSAPDPVPGSAGLTAAARETVVLPFNNVAGTEALLRAHANELAAVVVEPVMIDVGYIPATQQYIDALRALTSELGIVLLFDELLTGFRIAPGGARELYGVIPDLSTFGKAISNGFPLAVVEGREELMQSTDPTTGGTVGWVGTFNGHPVGVAAASAAVPLLADGSVQAHLASLTEMLRKGIEELSSRFGIPAVLAGDGGHFQPYFIAEAPSDYRSAALSDAARYAIWAETLNAAKILVPYGALSHCAFSDRHDGREVEMVLEASERAFARMS